MLTMRSATEKPLDEDILTKAAVKPWWPRWFRSVLFATGVDRYARHHFTLTRSLMDAQNVQGLEAALRNTPGITQQTTSPFNTNTFNVRGVQIRADSNYRLNGGLPIINYAPMPVENKQRVELLKGVSALYYGFAMPSGILNLVTKRAGSQPVTSLYSTADTEGGFGGGFDVGRRFGADDRFGLRINGYGADLQSTTNGVSGHRQLISGARLAGR
jgi:iron complex outermembrane receptor protein